ncbi:MAG: SprT-like domain-containing protein [Paludibacteraceae bacterium]|nr:SprT-like domain-containing protein [Paludibacteraceae bacterium]
MTPTVEYLEQKFDYYNQLCFEGQLIRPPFRLTRNVKTLGATRFHTRYHLFKGRQYYDLSIEITTRYDFPEDKLIEILVHEMIHYYILSHNWTDNTAHGQLFTAKMKELNSRFGLHITKQYRPDDNELIHRTGKWRTICILEFTDGKRGVMIPPQKYLSRAGKMVEQMEQDDRLHIAAVRWYTTNREIFRKFTPCRTRLHWALVDPTRLNDYLTDAKPIQIP